MPTDVTVDYRSSGVTGVVPIQYLREIIKSKKAKQKFGIKQQ